MVFSRKEIYIYRKDGFHEYFDEIQSTSICPEESAMVDAAASLVLFLLHGVRILLDPANTLGDFRVGHPAPGRP